MERLLLLDGNGLIYRGYFALIDQPLTTSRGELVTAVFGFTNIVLRAIQDVQPERSPSPSTSARPPSATSGTPSTRPPGPGMPDDMREQIPKVREVVRALGIPVYERRASRRTTSIATLDRPGGGRRLTTSRSSPATWTCSSSSASARGSWSRSGAASSNTVSYDLARIEERWGLRPDQMLDYKALKGDPTDNIPGIPGVGEKTASKLIATWETLDALYEHLDEVTPEKLRPAARGAPRDRSSRAAS